MGATTSGRAGSLASPASSAPPAGNPARRDGAASSAAPPRAWRWPLAVVGLLAACVAGQGVLLAAALRDPSFRVEEDYYARARRWDDVMAQARRNGELGWRVELAAAPVTTPAGRVVSARVLDRDGAPVDGARVHLTAFHNRWPDRVVEAELEPGAAAHAALLPLTQPGRWSVRLEVRRGADLFAEARALEVEGRP